MAQDDGQRSAVLSQFESWTRLLNEELGVKPNPDEPEPKKVLVYNFLAQCTKISGVRA